MKHNTLTPYSNLTVKQLSLLIGIGSMNVFLFSRKLMESGTISWVSFVSGCLLLSALTPLQYLHTYLNIHSQLYQQLIGLCSRIGTLGQVIIIIVVAVTLGMTLLLKFSDSKYLVYSFLLGTMLAASIFGLTSLIQRPLPSGQ